MRRMNENYYAFLLRIFRPGRSSNAAWHASLEDPHTRQVVDFNRLDTLFEYLLQLISPGEGSIEHAPPDESCQDS